MPGNFQEVPEWIIHQWPAPNYVDPVRRTWMPGFAITFPAVSTVLLAGRFWLRATKQSGGFGLDDLFIAIGWAVSIGMSTCAVLSAERYDLDRHTWDVKLENYEGAALLGWILQVMFLVSTCATKTSVLLFYRRMVSGTYSRRWLYSIYAALGFLGGYFVSIFLVYCFLCQPLSAYWESYNFDYDKPYKCIHGNVLSPFVGVLSVFTDIYTVILPCVMLAHVELHVPKRQRIGLNIIFGLGLIVAGFGIARTYYLWEMNNNYDTSWTGFTLLVWSLLECHVAVIFACAPSLRAFVRQYLGGTISRTWGSSKDRSQARSDRRYNTPDVKWQAPPEAPDDSVALGAVSKHPMSTVREQVERRASKDTMEEVGNFYHEESSSATPASRSVSEEPIRNADEYEAYAIRQLRYAFNKALPGDRRAEHNDWEDPRRRHELEDAATAV